MLLQNNFHSLANQLIFTTQFPPVNLLHERLLSVKAHLSKAIKHLMLHIMGLLS